MPRSQSNRAQYAIGYANATRDVESWLAEKLKDWDQIRTLTASRTAFVIGIEAALHGARRDIQRGAHRGASGRRAT